MAINLASSEPKHGVLLIVTWVLGAPDIHLNAHHPDGQRWGRTRDCGEESHRRMRIALTSHRIHSSSFMDGANRETALSLD